MKSRNQIVANALKKKLVAQNAASRVGDVIVEFSAPDASGLVKVQKRMSGAQFEEWMAKTRNSDKIQAVLLSLMQGEPARFVSAPVAVTVKAL